MTSKCSDCGTACYVTADKCRQCAQRDHKNRWDLMFKHVSAQYVKGSAR